MSRTGFSLSRLLFTLLLYLAASLPLAGARSDEPRWIRVSASHFSVLTDGDEKRGRDAVVRFEQMRVIFGQLLARDRIHMPEPMDLIALSDEEYAKVAPIRTGQAITDAGFFIPGEDRNYFVLNVSKDENWRVIARDFCQVYLNYNYPLTQAWFDEGLTQYFASLQLDNKRGQIGGDPDAFVELLNATAWLPIPDLFATGRAVAADQERSHHALFSAQSWMVMHYLLRRNKLPETGMYFDLVQNQHVPIEQAIQKAYGMSSLQFGQAVVGYFRSLALAPQPAEKGGQPATGGAGGSQFIEVTAADQIGSSMERVPDAEAQALLGEMSVRLPEHREQAVQALEAIAADPKTDDAIAHRGLAWVYYDKKEFEHAVEELVKGGEIDPKDPWTHYYLALVRRATIQSGEKGTEGLPNMIQDLRMVLNWDAEFAEARSMLGMAELEGGGAHAAMDSMRAAILLNPRNQGYLLNMAQIYMAAKNWDAATAMLERLKSSPDLQVAKAAGEQLDGLPILKKYGVPPQAESKPQPQATATSPAPPSAAAPSSTPVPAPVGKPAEPQTKAEKQNLPEEAASDAQLEQPPAQLQPDKRSIQFLKGKLVAVDCSHAPAAVLTVAAGSRVLKLRTEDYKALTLIGADEFSCGWKSRLVAVNYRAGGKSDGDLVSVEVE